MMTKLNDETVKKLTGLSVIAGVVMAAQASVLRRTVKFEKEFGVVTTTPEQFIKTLTKSEDSRVRKPKPVRNYKQYSGGPCCSDCDLIENTIDRYGFIRGSKL